MEWPAIILVCPYNTIQYQWAEVIAKAEEAKRMVSSISFPDVTIHRECGGSESANCVKKV